MTRQLHSYLPKRHEKIRTHETCTRMFIASSIILEKSPKSQVADEWITKGDINIQRNIMAAERKEGPIQAKYECWKY